MAANSQPTGVASRSMHSPAVRQSWRIDTAWRMRPHIQRLRRFTSRWISMPIIRPNVRRAARGPAQTHSAVLRRRDRSVVECPEVASGADVQRRPERSGCAVHRLAEVVVGKYLEFVTSAKNANHSINGRDEDFSTSGDGRCVVCARGRSLARGKLGFRHKGLSDLTGFHKRN